MKPFQATKKPITIEAIQWTGENLIELIDFTGKSERFNEWFPTWDDYVKHVKSEDHTFKIITPEGSMLASVGDYITKNKDGSFSVFKPKEFNPNRK